MELDDEIDGETQEIRETLNKVYWKVIARL